MKIIKGVSGLRKLNRALRLKNGQRPEVFTDARERVDEDLTTVTLHPTKGFRRLAGRRIVAQQRMAAMLA